MLSRRSLCQTLAIACLLLPGAFAYAQEAPDALVMRISTDVIDAVKADKAIQAGEVARIVSLVDAKVMPSVNFKRMTASAVGRNWRQARLETPVLSKAFSRFNIDWVWDGKPAIIQSRAVDETGYVQPTYKQLRAVRGTRSMYHNNAIQSWLVQENGEVKNVQLS